MEFFAVNGTRPIRLCDDTRQFASDSLGYKYGRMTKETPFVDLSDVVGYDDCTDLEKYDIAILKVAIAESSYFELSHEITKGEKVYAIGSALGDLTGSITSGIISSPSRMVGAINCIQMDAAISNGNSGGPLVNEYGEVLGINSFSFTNGQNLNLAIHISTLDELPKEKNFSINDYVEWWRTEIERSYRPTNSTDTNYFTYSIVNTYQHVTKKKCLLSFNDLENATD
ncbi:MAG: serine protease, partial [Clostridia bacterium]|nr:serine protease [Clostridia bacterium]